MLAMDRVKTVTLGLEEEKYEVALKIKSPSLILNDPVLMEAHKVWIETREDSLLKSKWIVGLKTKQLKYQGSSYDALFVYCQLMEMGSGYQVQGARSQVIFKMSSPPQVVRHPGLFAINQCFEQLIETRCDIECRIQLTLFNPSQEPMEENFRSKSVSAVKSVLASFFDADSTHFDLQIVCQDGTELQCHQAILKAHSPVFDSMLRSGLSESQSGVIHIDDVGGKVIEILIRYIYTGVLSPEWKDPDVIVEFVYAAVKYQMELLVDYLEAGTVQDLPVDTVRDLKNLTGKLSLKKAEAQLKSQLVVRTMSAKSSEDIVALFGESQ